MAMSGYVRHVLSAYHKMIMSGYVRHVVVVFFLFVCCFLGGWGRGRSLKRDANTSPVSCITSYDIQSA